MAAAEQTEIERKYTVGPDAVVPDLGAVPGIATAEVVPDAALEAVYFDTSDTVLAAAHIALRRRTGGHDAGWHLKLPAPVGRRELHAPIDPSRPDAVPAVLLDAVRSRIRDAPLTPLARLATTRRAVLLHDHAGIPRVEFADDTVTATDLRHGVDRAWREWEAEQVGDDPRAAARVLDGLEPLLLAAGAAHSPSASKLAQALGALEAPEAPTSPPSSAGDAFLVVLRGLVERLHRDELALLSGGAEEIHEARKTVRRIRSVLALSEFAGDTGDLTHDLRDLGATLGGARDLAVAAETAAGLLADLPTAPDRERARRRLVEEPLENAEQARVGVLDLLGTPGHFALLAALEDATGSRTAAGPRAGEPAASALPDALRRLGRRAVRRAARAAAIGDLDALHAARKAARRVRYVAEAFDAEGLPAGPAKLADRAQAVQDALGRHRDHMLFAGSLPGTSEAAAAAGENAFVHGVLAERAADAAKIALTEFESARHRLARVVERG